MNKTILITSGGTREYIDDVRVITNISTGTLGAKIAEEFYSHGYKVHYVHSKQSVMPHIQDGVSETARLIEWPIITVEDLYDTMKSILTAFKIDAVIHSAAVSDFTFKKEKAVKLSSSSIEDFIEFMRQTITPTPKIIQKIKEWAPQTLLVGFKFTVGETPSSLFQIAKSMMDKTGADLVLANDKMEMQREQKHIMHFVHKDQPVSCFEARQKSIGKENIAFDLWKWVENNLLPRN